MAGFRARYGAGPGHLVAVLVGSGTSAYAVSRVGSWDTLLAMALWLLGLLALHDVLLVPAYTLADRSLLAVTQRASGRPQLTNHIRVPVAWSGLLLAAWFPLVLRLSPGYESAAGRSDEMYLRNWLLVTVVLFTGSALLYAVRRARVS